jgi:hypothetical protein
LKETMAFAWPHCLFFWHFSSNFLVCSSNL